jgi:EmrB/QacA subfamily drug resistance transporter
MRPGKGFWILLATILGSSMVFIDTNVVNVAIPRIQLDLGASATSVQWVVESYALFLGALILLGGSLGDMFGRRRIFGIGVILFALSSAWCGFAADIGQLIGARAVQGIGGALLTPGSLSIIRAWFSDEQRGRSIGLWSAFSAITSALGPVIGGWLVQNASWRWVFFINIPLALAVLSILFLHVPESYAEPGNIHIDVPGALLATLGLGALVFGLLESNTVGLLHPLVLICILAGVLLLISFLFAERHSPAPMIPLSLFRSRTFAGTNLLTFLLYAALGGTLFFLPFNLIRVQGYSATAAGAALLPYTLLMFSLSRWSGGLVVRFGPRLPLIVGPLIAGVGYILFAVPGIGSGYWTTFFPAVLVTGLGMSITVAPLTTTVMGAASDRYAGAASGINNAVARIAGLFAIALLGICVLAVFNQTLDASLTTLHVSPAVRHLLDAQRSKLVGAEVPDSVGEALRRELSRAIAESFVAGFRLAMLINAGLAFAGSLCAFLMVAAPPRLPNSEEQEERLYGDNASTLTYASNGGEQISEAVNAASPEQK